MPDMRSSYAVVMGLALAACQGKPGPEGVASSASVAASAVNVAPKPTAEPLPKPEKLDVAALRAALKCGAKAAAGPCEVLEDFKECGAMNPVTQSGEGRWLGKGYLVKNGAFIEEYTLLRSKAVPASQVGAGSLPARLAIDSIPDERGGEKTNAEKAINAFERGDVPLPTNTAIRYVKERAEWSEAPVMAAEDNQLYVASGSGAYLCSRTKQRVLLVRRSSTRSQAADGVYAVLWPVSW
jgi:hypothetical protein